MVTWRTVAIAALVSSCSSGTDTPANTDPLYRLTTQWQGPDKSMGLVNTAERNNDILLMDSAEDATQQWRISPIGNGFFRLTNESTGPGLSLDVVNDGVFNRVQLAETGNFSGQLWQVTPLDNGYCRLTTQFLGMDMSLDIRNDDENNQVQMAPSGTFSGQHWQLAAVANAPFDDTLSMCTGMNPTSAGMTGPTGTTADTDDIAGQGFRATSAYRQFSVRGFTLLVSPVVDTDTELAGQVFTEVESQLDAIAVSVPEPALTELRRTRIWIELKAKDNGAAEYHVSATWLEQNGYNPDKAGDIELSNVRNFLDRSRTAQPWMLMHELAHAYQHSVTSANLVYPEVPFTEASFTEAYDNAVVSGKYESVEYVDGSLRRAYALTNEREYFAELTEAWFGRNDFFPFKRDQLRTFDTVGFELLKQVWSRR